MHRNRMRFDRNPAFSLQVHRIEELILSIALLDRAGALEQSIRQRRFAVIDVRDDAEIAGKLNSPWKWALCGRGCAWSIG